MVSSLPLQPGQQIRAMITNSVMCFENKCPCFIFPLHLQFLNTIIINVNALPFL